MCNYFSHKSYEEKNMEDTNREDLVWQANYYHRMKSLSSQKLKEFETLGVKPNHTDRVVKRYTLKEYIEFLGQKKAAEDFGCSEASCKSWRYGYRQPTINQAKQIIKACQQIAQFLC